MSLFRVKKGDLAKPADAMIAVRNETGIIRNMTVGKLKELLARTSLTSLGDNVPRHKAVEDE